MTPAHPEFAAIYDEVAKELPEPEVDALDSRREEAEAVWADDVEADHPRIVQAIRTKWARSAAQERVRPERAPRRVRPRYARQGGRAPRRAPRRRPVATRGSPLFAGTPVQMIDRTYGHLVASSEETARERLDVWATSGPRAATTEGPAAE